MRVRLRWRELLVAVLLSTVSAYTLGADTGTSSPSLPVLSSDELLQRAYALSISFDASQRAALLATLLECASCNKVNREQWAADLFKASQEMPADTSRERDQDTAVAAMSRWNPRRALKLAEQMDSPSAAALDVFFNRRGRNMRAVFFQVLRSEGNTAIPFLRQSLQKQGSSGYYPYSAAVPLLMHYSQGERELLFQEVLNFYQRSNPTPANELDFLEFMRTALSQMPAESIRPAALMFTNRLQAYAASNPRSEFVLSLNTSRGTTVLNNPGDRLIWESLPTLKQIDGTMADQLVSNRPALAAIQGATIYQQIPEQRRTGDMSVQQKTIRAEWESAQRLIAEAGTDPVRAAAEARNIADPYSRVDALAEIARRQAPRDPAGALKLLQEAEAASHQLRFSYEQIRAISDLAKTAEELHDANRVRSELESAFSLAHECILDSGNQSSEAKGLASSNGFGLLDLVAVGARMMPQYTIELIDTLDDDATEAYLYIRMAEQAN